MTKVRQPGRPQTLCQPVRAGIVLGNDQYVRARQIGHQGTQLKAQFFPIETGVGTDKDGCIAIDKQQSSFSFFERGQCLFLLAGIVLS